MNSQSIQLQDSVENTVKRLYPVLDDVIRCPYELIDQILQRVDRYAARKVFYKILGKDHLKDTETHTYLVYFEEIYKGRKNAKKRGGELEKTLVMDFQEKSFKVSQKFAAFVLKVKIDASNTRISPFEAVSYSSSCFEIRLTRAFKLYLHILRLKEYASMVSFAKGDERLLTNFRVHHTDMMYWVIRRHQWARGTIKYELKALKMAIGCVTMSNKCFFVLLGKIESELKGTWCQFKHKRIKKGAVVKEIELLFDSDKMNRERNRLNLRFEYEIELAKNGVDIDTIYHIRKLIHVNQTLEKDGKKYLWSPFYVLHTIAIAKLEYKKRLEQNEIQKRKRIGNFPGFLIKALFQAYWADQIEILKAEQCIKKRDNQQLFGKQMKSGVAVTAIAIPDEDMLLAAYHKKETIEQYLYKLSQQGQCYVKYVDYETGEIYWVLEEHFKRLEMLEKREAYRHIK
ncbi:MAG: hypothetical protein AAF620_00040 [Bacteroidota bacterium]